MSKEVKKTKKTVAVNSNASFFEKTEVWFKNNERKTLYFFLILASFLSFISFNARISEAHDDALYLEAGWRFVNEFPSYFYTQNAPLYPMFLGILVKLMGFKLIAFKIFSLVFNILGLLLFFVSLKGRIPAIVFLPVVLFHASNHLIIYYSSMTFTEAMYFFLQGLFIYYAVKIVDLTKNKTLDLKAQYKTWLMLGFSMLLLSTCKTSAIVVIPAVMLYFVLEKNYKTAGVALASYLVFKIPYELMVRGIWNAQNQFKGQGNILLQKDPYNASLGNEDAAGFIQRFLDNCNLYLSKRFYQLLGWRDENNIEVYGLLAFLTIAIALYGFWLLYKNKNKYMVLLGLFTGAQIVLSFFSLQARWDQPRIILICMPVLLILMLYVFYHLGNKMSLGQMIYGFIAIAICSSVLISSFKRGFKNMPIVQKNLKGDKYYGYTPDWQNFLKCSEWCADNLGKDAFVASRKAPMSFVYGKGKKFFPIYSVVKKDTVTEQSNPDSALAYFQQNKVTHVMLASLRLNPNDASQGFINTVHNIFAPIAQKYPTKLKLVHVEGAFEECSLYEIQYDK